ncbi:MAG: hypothetical protein J6N67_06115, partial [Desulfovibrio sp.]|nr:hypothetical protein [Desulfovibrio sp.]
MNEANLRALFKEFDRQANEEAKEAAAVRKNAHGILKTQPIASHADRQRIVLAYGMTQEVFSPEELRQFLNTIEKTRKAFNPRHGAHGVPYGALIRASRPVDVKRSKQVRGATLYQRKGDIIYFQVTGNHQAFYRVQIKLEEWNSYITDATPALKAVKNMIAGRLSFECPCGRHQYWYRYLATLGNYALKPTETGFPKIRNPQLTGCCCKHVLKVLHDLKSTRVMFLLAKELDRERAKPGFTGGMRKEVLSAADLRLAQAKRMTRAAMLAFRIYEKEAAQIKRRLRPRKPDSGSGAAAAPKVSKEVLNAIKTFLKLARAANMKPDTMLNQLAKAQRLTRAQIDAIIKE